MVSANESSIDVSTLRGSNVGPDTTLVGPDTTLTRVTGETGELSDISRGERVAKNGRGTRVYARCARIGSVYPPVNCLLAHPLSIGSICSFSLVCLGLRRVVLSVQRDTRAISLRPT